MTTTNTITPELIREYLTTADSLARARAASDAFMAINGTILSAGADPLYPFVRDAMRAAVANWESLLDRIGPDMAGQLRDLNADHIERIGL